jgi:gamma-glutamyltranspeptidase/glutathione hydrolase
VKTLGHNSAAYLHLLVEAKKIAFADRAAWLADYNAVPPAVLQTLRSKEYAAQRRKEIDPNRAASDYRPFEPPGSAPARKEPRPASGDTIYMTVADREGNVVSLIQSIYESFGAGIVAGDTGIALHNRGSLFSLQAGHPNVLVPGKRPLHTLVPAMVLKDQRPWLSFGVMGGDMQPQGHVQVLLNMLVFGMNPQEAGEAARAREVDGAAALESGIGEVVREGLRAKGHRIVASPGSFGGFQGILIDRENGVLHGASDPRKDGCAAGY